MANAPLLQVKNLHAEIDGKPILRGLDLTIEQGEVHALMGPNGSGKSTLSNVLMGHPSYEVTEGEIWFKGENITEAEADERAKAGIFLAFQYPTSIPGVSLGNFLLASVKAIRGADNVQLLPFRKELNAKMDELGINKAFARRYVNEGFSGGEKKRHEILQLELLKPAIAVLDETDSGLDVDALKIVSEGVNRAKDATDLGVLLITHYTRILRYITPQFVHVMVAGRIVEEGGPELADRLESEGYDRYLDPAAPIEA